LRSKRIFQSMHKTTARLLKLLFAGGMLAVLLLSGCATSAPTAKFSQTLATSSRVAGSDETKVVITTMGDVSMLDYEKSRLAQRIQERLNAKKLLNVVTEGNKSYEVEVAITRYEKGSAIARAFLAGLGQIHVNGTVSLFVAPERKQVGEFTIKKTFAWGGLYGGITSMEDVELGFADGIAAALTGQEEDAPKKAKDTNKQVALPAPAIGEKS
jgi:hypothetical protein